MSQIFPLTLIHVHTWYSYYRLLHTNDSPLLRFHRLILAMLTHLEGVSTVTQLMSAAEEILSPTSDTLSANISIVRGDYN